MCRPSEEHSDVVAVWRQDNGIINIASFSITHVSSKTHVLLTHVNKLGKLRMLHRCIVLKMYLFDGSKNIIN